MTISNYLENKLLDLVLRNTTFPPIVSVWASLHTADPGETGTGAPLASTPRFQVTFNPAVSATSVNAAQALGVGSATGTVLWMALWDGSATATANCLWTASMTSGGARAINAPTTWVLASGVLRITLD